jgi:hypothetical protein
MVYTKEYKELIAFEYPCYICGNILSRAKQAIDHVRRIHGYNLPTRSVGRRRPPDPQYEYQNDIQNGEYDVIHYSCPSCWYHCPEAGLAELSEHINDTHHPVNLDPSKNEGGFVHGAEVNEHQRHEHEGEGSDEEMVQVSEKYKESGRAHQKVHISHHPKSSSASNGSGSSGLDGIPEKETQDIMNMLNEVTSRFKKLFDK